MTAAKAFVYAACEDFGIALVEAQAAGTPVIAYATGGASETVRDIRVSPLHTGTGVLFKMQTEAALIEAVKTFEAYEGKFDPEYARTHAARFSSQVFARKYLNFLDACKEKTSNSGHQAHY